MHLDVVTISHCAAFETRRGYSMPMTVRLVALYAEETSRTALLAVLHLFVYARACSVKRRRATRNFPHLECRVWAEKCNAHISHYDLEHESDEVV